jgi:hypothetical protein
MYLLFNSFVDAVLLFLMALFVTTITGLAMYVIYSAALVYTAPVVIGIVLFLIVWGFAYHDRKYPPPQTGGKF